MTSTHEQLTERIDEADGMRMDMVGAAEPHTPSNQQAARRIQVWKIKFCSGENFEMMWA